MKQFGQRNENVERRDSRDKVEKISLYDFEEMLRNHKWTFIDQDNFRDYVKNRREEDRLFHTAMQNGPDYVRSFYYAQRNRTSQHAEERVRKVQLEAIAHYEKMIVTGNAEFDEYRKRLDNFDWYYDYSDDGGVARRGHERYHELKKIAETKGGIFHDLWIHRNQMHYVNKTNSNKIEYR